MAALTGTADEQTCSIVCSQLAMKDPIKIYVSPNRENLRFAVRKTKKDCAYSELDWLVSEVNKKGKSVEKTIIFCNTMNEIASVMNYLMLKLGKFAYYPVESRDASNCLLGIYHSSSWLHSKERVVKSFKGQGKIRVIVSSTALSMGVNFPDVRFVVNWGPARNLLDQHQEAGRAGRDGVPSHVLVIYYGQQLSCCEEGIKEFVKSEGCLRVAAYKTLDETIVPLEPAHSCCSHCSCTCTCNNESCIGIKPPFEILQPVSTDHEMVGLTRPVSNSDKLDLKDALDELRVGMTSKLTVFDSVSSHGFSIHLVEDVVKNASKIFTVGDIF